MGSKSEQPAKEELVLFTVLTPIEHNGKEYQEGDTLSLQDVEGDQLIELGAIELQ